MTDGESNPETTATTTAWLTRDWALWLVAVVVSAMSLLAMNEADPDLWGHVLYGREALRSGELEMQSSWNYTAIGYRWINHENLAELALAAADNWAGAGGLLALKLSLSLLVLGLVTGRLLSRGVHPLTIGFIVLVLAQTIAFHWHFRPQVFGYALFAIVLTLLDWCFAGWAGAWWLRDPRTPTDAVPPYSSFRMRQLWWLVPVGAVWANTHGSFVAGACIVVAYLGLRAIEAFCMWGSAGWGRVKRFAMMATALLLATLLNPYGPRLPLWMWEALNVPRPEIDDWERLPLLTGEALGFWTIVLTTIWASWRTRRIDFTHTVLLILLTWQGVSHIRHLPWLGMAWAFWMAGPLDQVRRGIVAEMNRHQSEAIIAAGSAPAPASGRWWIQGGLVLWIATVVCTSWPQWTELRVNRGEYPVAALQYMADHDLSGRTIVTFNWAQYALGCFDAAEMPSRVAFDGRFRTCYPQQVIDIYFDFLFGKGTTYPRYRSPLSPPVDPERALRYEDPELILISRKQQPATNLMAQQSADWVLLYQDSLAQVWGRRDLFDDPQSSRYVPVLERQLTDQLQVGFAQWPAVPVARHRQVPAQLVRR